MNEKYGKIAYEAYCMSRGWKSVRGERLPQFYEQSEELQRAWIVAGNAVADEIANEQSQGK